MKFLVLIILLLVGPTVFAARDLRPTIKREAAQCALAWQRSDGEAILARLPERVIAASGGRAAARREIKGWFASAREYGVESQQVSLGEPSAPQQIGRWLTTLVPFTAVLHCAHFDLTQETALLGLSADQGKHWSFVPLYQVTSAELAAWYPEFAGKIAVPATRAPRIEVTY
jgi:hypothetical protein